MKTLTRKTPDIYFQLVRRFPLRPVRTGAEHRDALALVEELVVRSNSLDRGESDYLETLASLVEKYEAKRYSLRGAAPHEVLAHLMEARGMRPSELGKLIGSKGNASLILRGRRELSKAHIRKLAEHFHVSPAVFI